MQGILNCLKASRLEVKLWPHLCEFEICSYVFGGGYFYIVKPYSNIVNNNIKPLNETLFLLCKMALVTLISSLCYDEL